MKCERCMSVYLKRVSLWSEPNIETGIWQVKEINARAASKRSAPESCQRKEIGVRATSKRSAPESRPRKERSTPESRQGDRYQSRAEELSSRGSAPESRRESYARATSEVSASHIGEGRMRVKSGAVVTRIRRTTKTRDFVCMCVSVVWVMTEIMFIIYCNS